MTINITKDDFLKYVQLLLLIVVTGLLLWSRPWAADSSELTRTIQVSGEATIEAVPDEFVFYPYFEQEGKDRDQLKVALTQQANTAVEELKELGVAEEKIKLDASSYDRWYWRENEEGILTVSLNITVDNKDLAQEVQDYLLTLDIKGQLTPQAVFSQSKQKELDAQAVEQASNDARAKAEAQAKLFGADLGKVIKVEQGFDSVFPVAFDGVATLEVGAEDAARSSLPVLPGENEYRQTVTVTYELK